MKRIIKLLAVLLSASLCLPLAGCDGSLYSYDRLGNRITNDDVDYIQEKYSAAECRAEAERLFGTQFEVTASHEPTHGEDRSKYTLRSKDIPFEFNVFSERVLEYSGDTMYLYAHAYCDYYEQMMNHKAEQAAALAEKYGLNVQRVGQSCRTFVSGYDQLESVYEYLDATNELYSFTVVESQMTNILRDIRNRPMLDVYLDPAAFELGEEDDSRVIKLYYTINRDSYDYTKEALLSAIQENYISLLDELGLRDSAVTASVREERCKPALTQLCINGEPVEAKDCGDYTLDPNIVFDYNWLMNNYYGDIRICAPSANYDRAPDSIGDDRNFKYLVELLGGRYSSKKEYDYTSSYYSAKWWLGGNTYSAGAICQQHIPTVSSYSINGAGVHIDHAYSKEMWGLENGYGPEDYYIRLTPEGLGTLLGVTVEADCEKGTLNLITPQGYFDFEPPEEREGEGGGALFFVEDVIVGGVGKTANHYIIYRSDGSIMEEYTTEEYTYAECYQLTDSVVVLTERGNGLDKITFYDTVSGEISDSYLNAIPLNYPFVVHSPRYSDKIIIENVITRGYSVIVDGGLYYADKVVTAAVVSEDRSQITLSYYVPDPLNYFKEKTNTFDLVLPE